MRSIIRPKRQYLGDAETDSDSGADSGANTGVDSGIDSAIRNRFQKTSELAGIDSDENIFFPFPQSVANRLCYSQRTISSQKTFSGPISHVYL